MRISPHTLQLAIPVAAIGMRLASQGTASASYLVLAGYALLGRAQAIQALALAWLFNMLNSRIAPAVSYAAVGRYAVIFAAALSVLLLRSGKRAPLTIGKLTFGTLALGIFIIGHSLLFSRVRV